MEGSSEQFYEEQKVVKPDDLLAFLQDKFSDAFILERHDYQRLGQRRYKDNNGTFYKRMLFGSEDHVLIPGSIRILLEPDQAYNNQDTYGIYAEVYALGESNGVTLESPAQFLVRSFVEHRPGPFWLVDQNGVQYAEAGEGVEELQAQELHDPTIALERAEDFFEVLCTYNIVASTD